MACIRPADDTKIGTDSVGRPADAEAPDVHLIDASGLYALRQTGPSRQAPREELRLDVDGRFPQMTASGTIRQGLAGRLHWVAALTPAGVNRWTGGIWFKDGAAALLPQTNIDVAVQKTPFGIGQTATVTFSGGGLTERACRYGYASRYFHPIEFECDTVEGAAASDAPLSIEPAAIEKVFRFAGFNVGKSGGDGIIPMDGADGTWSDMELHDAMQVYWSRFASRARRAMWLLTAARHHSGADVLGLMFDDVGPNSRPGAALFHESFIRGAPARDADAAAWAARGRIRTACREMAHAFDPARAWPAAPGTPRWAPPGGAPAFFADFDVCFSDAELMSLRHAPERTAPPAGGDWFDRHGFEQAAVAPHPALRLQLRADRATPLFEFLEPVVLELVLTNDSDRPVEVDAGLLAAGDGMIVMIRRGHGPARRWLPYARGCRRAAPRTLAPGESIRRSLFAAAGRNGWDLAEPGAYEVQVALPLPDEDLVSNRFRLRIAVPRSVEEESLAPDFFTDAVGRILAFDGSRALGAGNDVLNEILRRLADRRVAAHAGVALALPLRRGCKRLVLGQGSHWMTSAADAGGRIEVAVADADGARAGLAAALMQDADRAAETLGHVDYKDCVDDVAQWLSAEGDAAGAAAWQDRMYDTLARRKAADSLLRRVARTRDADAAGGRPTGRSRGT
ncbi:MAG: hypothetical protein AB7S71_18370 [Dongiaceae bacterium]